MYIKLLCTGICANIREIMLISIISSASWTLQGVWRCGRREIIYLSLHCHHQNDFCIKMGSDESHFNVSVASGGQSHKTVSTNHNLFEEKGDPKRY